MSPHQIEIAARLYCHANNLNPDALVPHGATPNEYGVVTAQLLHSPQWQLIAPSIKRHRSMDEAIMRALTES